MTPALCPNCSGYIHDQYKWVLGRPSLFTSRRTGKVRIVGCCEFSGKSNLPYDTEEEACTAWLRYRDAMAQRDSRLKFMLEQLDRLDQRLNPRTTDAAPAA